LSFIGAVTFRFEAPVPFGEAPDGFRLDFRLEGRVEGPRLKGRFPSFAACLIIDRNGIGIINARVPLLLDDGARAELEATGRYGDFGQDGYYMATQGKLAESALGWYPRFLTGDERYAWLNRIVCLGVGWIRPSESRVEYDLFAASPGGPSLYDRLGGRSFIDAFASDFVDGLDNPRLLAQNSQIKVARQRIDTATFKQRVADILSDLTGGPARYSGRSMRDVHSELEITEADWAIVASDVGASLERRRLPSAERLEMLQLLEGIKRDVVTTTGGRGRR
jgi:hemoglobin